MKILISTLAAFLSINVSAETLRCSLILVTPYGDRPSQGNWIPPGAEIIAFDYDTDDEKTLYVGVDEVHWPSSPAIQRTLKLVANVNQAVFTLEFSKFDPYGTKLGRDSYGYFQTMKGQQKKDARWTRAIGRTASLFEIPVAAKVIGQTIMTCVEK